MEKKKNKKVALIVIISIIAVIAIAVSVVVIYNSMGNNGRYTGPMYTSEEQVYDYFSAKIENKYDLNDHNSDIEEFIKDINKDFEDDTSAQIVQSASPVDGELKEICDEGNRMIITYFEEVYDISVEERLNELKAYQYDIPEDETGGLFMDKSEESGADGKTIYLNVASDCNLEESKWDILTVYCHESMHYLGAAVVDSDDFENGVEMWLYFSEGVAESFACSIISHSEEYVNYCNEMGNSPNLTATAYFQVTPLVYQMVIADTDLVKLIFDRDDYVTAGELDKYIDESGMNGEDIAKVTSLVEINAERDHVEIAQYYVGEYCKTFELSNEEQIKIADNFIVPIEVISKK